MNSEERKELSVQNSIIQKRKNLQVAYNLYKMGYSWKYKERLVYEGFKPDEVDNIAKDMFEIFENALYLLNMEIGTQIANTYEGTNGNYKGSNVRNCREVIGMLSKLMLDDGTNLYNDLESLQEGWLSYVTHYTLYEFGCEDNEGFTLVQMAELTD